MKDFNYYKRRILNTYDPGARQRLLGEALCSKALTSEEWDRLVEIASPDAA